MRESLPKYMGHDEEYQTPLGAESADILDDKRLDRKDRAPAKTEAPAKSAPPPISPTSREDDPELDAYLDYLIRNGGSWVD